MLQVRQIHVGMRFAAGNVSFCVMGRTKGKPGFWDVHQNVVGAGFRTSRGPSTCEMSEEKIMRLLEDHVAGNIVGEMHTIGTRSGERMRAPRELHEMYARRRTARSTLT